MIEATDFYRWFHLREVGRTPGADGAATVRLKPGAFEEVIDLTVELDAARCVRSATLMLDRPWLAEPGVPAASALDLAASFLTDLAGEHPAALDLANGLRQWLARNPGTIVREGARVRPATLTPEVADALAVYEGKRARAELRDALPHVVVHNRPDGRRLRIALEYGTSDPVPEARASPPRMSEARYLGLFVQAGDLPAGMTMPQDSRRRGPDPGDDAFRACGGTHAGLARWDSATGPINRLIDIRAVFPDAQAAARYYDATLRAQMENMPPIAGAPTVGERCAVVGGNFPDRLTGGAGHTSVCYLFIVGPVWVKLFAADYSNARMGVAMVHGIARDIARRIAAAIPDPATGGEKARPWWRKILS